MADDDPAKGAEPTAPTPAPRAAGRLIELTAHITGGSEVRAGANVGAHGLQVESLGDAQLVALAVNVQDRLTEWEAQLLWSLRQQLSHPGAQLTPAQRERMRTILRERLPGGRQSSP